MAKAKIIIKRSSSEETVDVMFNPNEYTLDSSNHYAWQAIPGLQNPIGQFVNGESTTLTTELFFDTYEKKEDVRKYTSQITGLLQVDSDLHAPPQCRFVWGTLDFTGIAEKVTQRYTMFSDAGIPVRATLNVTFRSVQSMKQQYQNIPRQSADRTKQKMLNQGEELWMLASEEYEDPGQWRAIAEANGIDNPRKPVTGRKIIIPRLE
jgi:hypothetical protein